MSTQSKSKTQITKSVQGKFNCITVKNNGTQHGIYVTDETVTYLAIFISPKDLSLEKSILSSISITAQACAKDLEKTCDTIE